MAVRHRGVRLYGAVVLMVLLSAVLFWIVGFLPWVLAGFALPAAQAHGPAAGMAGVRLAVPLVVTRLPELVTSSLVAGVLAGLVPIAFPRLSRLLGVVVTGSIGLGTTSAVLVVSRRALEQHASAQFAADQRVVQGLVLAVVGAAVLGLAVGLAATVRHGLVAVAAGLVAAGLPVWLAALPWLEPGPVVQLLAGVTLAVGLVVSVHRTRWSMLLWPVGLGLAWLGAPLAAASGYGATHLRPSSGAGVGAMLRGAANAASARLGADGQPWWPWAMALALAVAWLILIRRNRRASTGSRKTHDDTPHSNHNLSQKVDAVTSAPLAFSSHAGNTGGVGERAVRWERGGSGTGVRASWSRWRWCSPRSAWWRPRPSRHRGSTTTPAG